MIFYTLKGPSHRLEIHDDKILLIKKRWLNFFFKPRPEVITSLVSLSHFKISSPRFLFWGKIEWKGQDGAMATFRFSTNSHMVKKIESYLQKRIEKNILRLNPPPKKEVLTLVTSPLPPVQDVQKVKRPHKPKKKRTLAA